ncbi:MAG: sugar transferase [bacterium]|nr:sugar transferase [bacterium]
MKRSDLFFTALLIPLDYMAVVVSFMLAYLIRVSYPTIVPIHWLGQVADTVSYEPDLQLYPLIAYVPAILWLVAAMVVTFIFTGLYRARRFTNTSEASSQILRSVAYTFLLLLLVTFVRGNTILPRLVILYAMVLTVFALVLTRWLVHFMRVILQRYGVGVVRVAVLGKRRNADRAISFINSFRGEGYRFARQYSLGEREKLLRAIDRRKFDELIIAVNHIDEQELIDIREACIEKRVGFAFVPSMLEVLTSRVEVKDMRGFTMIEVPLTPLEGWGYIVKRIVDLTGSIVGLIILSPLLILIALAIYIDSPGPIFFKHKRLGQQLEEFSLFKFRTMKTEFCDGEGYDKKRARAHFEELLNNNKHLKEEWQTYQKLKHDPRVTRLGTILRKTSLDELPQLFNALRGDVSLVGPRPIVRNELEKYGQMRHRLSAIKPGITGLWQVSGRNDTTYEERVRLDMVYVENWSLWLDVVIMLKTINTLLFRKGAY